MTVLDIIMWIDDEDVIESLNGKHISRDQLMKLYRILSDGKQPTVEDVERIV